MTHSRVWHNQNVLLVKISNIFGQRMCLKCFFSHFPSALICFFAFSKMSVPSNSLKNCQALGLRVCVGWVWVWSNHMGCSHPVEKICMGTWNQPKFRVSPCLASCLKVGEKKTTSHMTFIYCVITRI